MVITQASALISPVYDLLHTENVLYLLCLSFQPSCMPVSLGMCQPSFRDFTRVQLATTLRCSVWESLFAFTKSLTHSDRDWRSISSMHGPILMALTWTRWVGHTDMCQAIGSISQTDKLSLARHRSIVFFFIYFFAFQQFSFSLHCGNLPWQRYQ